MALPFLQRNMPPIYQAGLFFGGALFFMLLNLLFNLTGWYSIDPLFPWSIATAVLLLYAVFNSLMSLNADSFLKYWGRSIYAFMALAFANGVAAWLCSGITISQAQSYRWIYIVVTIGFVVFLTLINLMRKIVEFAEKEEWNQPRRKR